MGYASGMLQALHLHCNVPLNQVHQLKAKLEGRRESRKTFKDRRRQCLLCLLSSRSTHALAHRIECATCGVRCDLHGGVSGCAPHRS